MNGFWPVAFLVVQSALAVWGWRRRKFGTIFDPLDESTKRIFSQSMTWTLLAGVFWGCSFFWVGSAITNWTFPQAAFIPVILGQICMAFAARPPVRR